MVVCPLAVVDNWEREFKVWCPEVDVVVYKGSQASREMIQRHEVKPAVPAASASNASKEKPRKRRKGPIGGRVTRGSSNPKKDEDSDSEDAEEGSDSEGEARNTDVNSLKVSND